MLHPRDYPLAAATRNAVWPDAAIDAVSAALLLRTELSEIDPISRVFSRVRANPAASSCESPEKPLLAQPALRHPASDRGN